MGKTAGMDILALFALIVLEAGLCMAIAQMGFSAGVELLSMATRGRRNPPAGANQDLRS